MDTIWTVNGERFDANIPAERAKLIRIFRGLYDTERDRKCAEAAWGSALRELEGDADSVRLERDYPVFMGAIQKPFAPGDGCCCAHSAHQEFPCICGGS